MNTIRFAGSSALSLESSVQFALWDLVRESLPYEPGQPGRLPSGLNK